MVRKMTTVLYAAVILILFAIPTYAADLKLRLAHPVPVGSIFHSWAVQFANNLKNLSGGSIETEIIGGGVLGNPQQLLAQGRAGKLDMWLIDPMGPMMAKEGMQFAVLWVPFLFRDQEHYRKYLAGDVFKNMMGDAEEKIGIKYLGTLGNRSPRAISTAKKPVRTPEDLKGLKIRIPQLPFIAEVWKKWGATPTPIKGSDLYQALQSGLVDGDDNGILNVVERGLDEVLKYFTPINYVHSTIAVWMSGQTWSNLTELQRSWVLKAAKMVDEGQEDYSTAMASFLEKAKAKGMVIVEPDLAKFQAPVADIIAKYDGKFWPQGLYKKIKDIQ